MLYQPPRLYFEDRIIHTIQQGKDTFWHIGTSWNFKTDKQYLINALMVSIRQIRCKLYYGSYDEQIITDAIKHLEAA